MSVGPTIPRAEVEAICASTWSSEATARGQAAILDDNGWKVQHHYPPEVSTHRTGRRAATVTDPASGRYVGDLFFRPDTGSGSA
ncbi:MAG TPA: hypothetical protein VF062_06460 [Candidatus Limnocylindrales bacterium]